MSKFPCIGCNNMYINCEHGGCKKIEEFNKETDPNNMAFYVTALKLAQRTNKAGEDYHNRYAGLELSVSELLNIQLDTLALLAALIDRTIGEENK